jgi:hypothetical protein
MSCRLAAPAPSKADVAQLPYRVALAKHDNFKRNKLPHVLGVW